MMKYTLLLPFILFALTNCEQEETTESDFKSELGTANTMATVQYTGPIAADGCDWLTHLDGKKYRVSNLPEAFKKDSLYFFLNMNTSDSLYQCSFNSHYPYLSIGDDGLNHIKEAVWTETQCSDPWARVLDDDVIFEIIDYLVNQGIALRAIYVYQSEEDINFCAACSCGTGRTFHIWVDESDYEQILDLGFVMP